MSHYLRNFLKSGKIFILPILEKCTHLCPFRLARWRGVWGKTVSGVVLLKHCIKEGSVRTSSSTVSNLDKKYVHIKDNLHAQWVLYLPYCAASSKAVSPRQFLMPGSHACSRRRLTTCVWPYWAAQWRAVSSSFVWNKQNSL